MAAARVKKAAAELTPAAWSRAKRRTRLNRHRGLDARDPAGSGCGSAGRRCLNATGAGTSEVPFRRAERRATDAPRRNPFAASEGWHGPHAALARTRTRRMHAGSDRKGVTTAHAASVRRVEQGRKQRASCKRAAGVHMGHHEGDQTSSGGAGPRRSPCPNRDEAGF
jgi:hypothetical protein